MKEQVLLNRFAVIFIPHTNDPLRVPSGILVNLSSVFTIDEQEDRILEKWSKRCQKANHVYTFKVLRPNTPIDVERVQDKEVVRMYYNDALVIIEDSKTVEELENSHTLQRYLSYHDEMVIQKRSKKAMSRILNA